KALSWWAPPFLLLLIAGLVQPDWTVDACRLYRGQYDRDLAIIRDVETLTTRDEFVMDAKGEAILPLHRFMASMLKPFTPAEIKCFQQEKKSDALMWVSHN